MNFYNEFDAKAAAWLRELIKRGLIPPGDVDERSIAEVKGHELSKYTQCHFFAGIGGWSEALRLAGWPADEPVWTGSCPCQPFSAAGAQKGEADSRHLWPELRRLIAECAPPIVFGEQVASSLGREWLAGVRVDLEKLAYAVGAADLCAAGVGAPHIRQRLFWLADAQHSERRAVSVNRQDERHGQDDGRPETHGQLGACGEVRGWSDFDFIPCRDGKARRVESGTFPLADGVPARVGRLRGYGNAIVPQVAATFITAFKEACR